MNTRARGWIRIAALLLAEAILVGVSGVPAYAQFPDLLSDTECPGCRAQPAAALPFEGTWSTALTAAADARWTPADFACVTACTADGLNARALRFGCDALGFAEQVESPLPLTIRRESGALVLRYEERGVVRTIGLDGGERAPAGGDARLGVSAGHFDHDALVVETQAGGVHATERYSVSSDGQWLELALELTSSDKGGRPTVLTKRWLRTPNARIATHGCDVMSAGLDASLADYLDPSKIDARRR
ncbi:MAG: hypothetical protein ABI640_20305 [Gammaproteobacteria bacterium]